MKTFVTTFDSVIEENIASINEAVGANNNLAALKENMDKETTPENVSKYNDAVKLASCIGERIKIAREHIQSANDEIKTSYYNDISHTSDPMLSLVTDCDIYQKKLAVDKTTGIYSLDASSVVADPLEYKKVTKKNIGINAGWESAIEGFRHNIAASIVRYVCHDDDKKAPDTITGYKFGKHFDKDEVKKLDHRSISDVLPAVQRIVDMMIYKEMKGKKGETRNEYGVMRRDVAFLLECVSSDNGDNGITVKSYSGIRTLLVRIMNRVVNHGEWLVVTGKGK